MILGIKTTGGVAKLKTKTTDGVTKAVECACCKCNPNALWGPGYDTQPSEIQMLGYTLQRIGSCQWLFGDYDQMEPYVILDVDGEYVHPEIDYEWPITSAVFYVPVTGSENLFRLGEAIRTGGVYPAPYGTYTVVLTNDNRSDIITNIGDTFTISPPA